LYNDLKKKKKVKDDDIGENGKTYATDDGYSPDGCGLRWC